MPSQLKRTRDPSRPGVPAGARVPLGVLVAACLTMVGVPAAAFAADPGAPVTTSQTQAPQTQTTPSETTQTGGDAPPATDPPADSTSDPTQAPTDPSTPPTDPASPPDGPTTPPSTPAKPAPTPGPQQAAPAPPAPTPDGPPPSDSGVSAAAAEYAAELAAAQSALESAQESYDTASATYAALKKQYAGAKAQADRLHALATQAKRDATLSKRALGALVQALSRQSDGHPGVGALFGDHSVDDLLFQLGAMDKLSHLTGSVRTVRERADADAKRAAALAGQEQEARKVLAGIPLDKAKDTLAEASAALDAAKARMTDLQATEPAFTGLTATPLVVPSGTWIAPVVGPITDRFGPRTSLPDAAANWFHAGTDLAAACGTPIRAAASGVVEKAEPLGTYGNWILIDDGSGVETGYAHIATGTTLVSVGTPVSAGQIIAAVGETGDATGCHLHFEVRVDGTQIDPQPFMAARGVILGE